MASDVVARIDARLAEVRRDHEVLIPLAIESGSRAWGFPSPDSDYDCRFVYVRPASHFLTLWSGRDVIETPMDGILDVNGWEFGKALKLLLKGNAVIIEWLMSPIVYDGEARFRREFLALADRLVDRDLIIRHYIHLGRRQRTVHLPDGVEVPLKKLFYALRPAAALRWLRGRPTAVLPPMHFPTLMAECDPPAALAEVIAELLERKAVTHELGKGAAPPEVLAFIDAEFEQLEQTTAHDPELVAWRRREAEGFFVKTTLRLDEGALSD